MQICRLMSMQLQMLPQELHFILLEAPSLCRHVRQKLQCVKASKRAEICVPLLCMCCCKPPTREQHHNQTAVGTMHCSSPSDQNLATRSLPCASAATASPDSPAAPEAELAGSWEGQGSWMHMGSALLAAGDGLQPSRASMCCCMWFCAVCQLFCDITHLGSFWCSMQHGRHRLQSLSTLPQALD